MVPYYISVRKNLFFLHALIVFFRWSIMPPRSVMPRLPLPLLFGRFRFCFQFHIFTVGHRRRLILVSLLPRLASSQTAVQTSVFFNMFLFINLHKNWHACRYALHLYLCQTASKSDCAKRNERLLKKMPGGG